MWDFQQRGGEFRHSGFGHTEFNYQIFAVFMDILFSHFTGNRRFDAFLEVCFEQF